jgi:hypothetical protein
VTLTLYYILCLSSSSDDQETFSFHFTLSKDAMNDNQQELYYLSELPEQSKSMKEQPKSNKHFLTVSFLKEDKHTVLILLLKNKLLKSFRELIGSHSSNTPECMILRVCYQPIAADEVNAAEGPFDGTGSSSNGVQSSVLGKRRLSKAERKRLAKQPKNSMSDSQTVEVEDMESAVDIGEIDNRTQKCRDENETTFSVYFLCKISQNDHSNDHFRVELSLLSDYSACDNISFFYL